MKKTLVIRVISFFLVLALVLSSVDMKVFAKNEENETESEYEINAQTEENTFGLNIPQRNNDVSTWDCVWFGHYWQNDTNGDGIADNNDQKEPIKWRVLSIDGNKALLLSDKVLDVQQYNTEAYICNSWNACSLNTWMNSRGEYLDSGFYKNAFDYEERLLIYNTYLQDENVMNFVFALSNSDYASVDYGFVTSNSVLNTYTERTAIATPYALKKGVSKTGNKGQYWTRTIESLKFVDDVKCACTIGYYGTIFAGTFADKLTETNNGVRPAVYVDLSKDGWFYAGTVCSDGKTNEVQTNEPDEEFIEEFSPSIYKANSFLKNKDRWNSVYEIMSEKTWCSIISDTINIYENEFIEFWRADFGAKAITDTSYLSHYQVDAQDIYTALLVKLLDDSKQNLFTEVLENQLIDTSIDNTSKLKKIKKMLGAIGDVDVSQNNGSASIDFDIKLDTKIDKIMEKGMDKSIFTQTTLEEFNGFKFSSLYDEAKLSNYFSEAVDACSTLADYLNTVQNMKLMMSISMETQEIVRDLYAQSLMTDDIYYQGALKQLCDAMDNFDLYNKKIIGYYGVDYVCSLIWDEVILGTIKKCIPGLDVVLTCIKSGKWLADTATNAQGIIDAKIDCVVFNSIIESVDLLCMKYAEAFLKDPSSNNAVKFNKSLNICFTAHLMDRDLADAFSKETSERNYSVFGLPGMVIDFFVDIFKSKNYEEAKKILTDEKDSLNKRMQILNIAWIEDAEEEYPGKGIAYAYRDKIYRAVYNLEKNIYTFACPVDVELLTQTSHTNKVC